MRRAIEDTLAAPLFLLAALDRSSQLPYRVLFFCLFLSTFWFAFLAWVCILDDSDARSRKRPF